MLVHVPVTYFVFVTFPIAATTIGAANTLDTTLFFPMDVMPGKADDNRNNQNNDYVFHGTVPFPLLSATLSICGSEIFVGVPD